MKLLISLTVAYLLPTFLFAQIELAYSWQTKDDDGTVLFTNYYKLLIDRENHYFMKIDSTVPTSSDAIIRTASKDFKGFFFSGQTRSFYYMGFIFNKAIPVVDSTAANQFQWQYQSGNGPTILGFKTLVAKTTFRGRTYTAYYAPELPYSVGPFKFSGLPGLILEIFNDDDKNHFTATQIQKRTTDTPIENPYASIEQKRYISFKSYKELYLKKLAEQLQKLQAEEKEGYTYSSLDTSLELTSE